MAAQVPWVDSLDKVYGDGTPAGVPSEYRQRFENLVSTFSQQYHHKPDFVSRSPGRVNIIGEHIDYSLYNVLPTAVINDVLIAVQVLDDNNSNITIANINSSKYPTEETTIPKAGDVVIDKANHKWSNYFLAGVSGSLETLRRDNGGTFASKSMKLLVDGNVPAGGGLSSSAAFVCASALAMLAANGAKVSKQDLLDECIVSERSVGVYSGGMDQAASVFSERGNLLYCRFWPKFAAEHVPVPEADPEFAILVAQSFVTSDKAVTAQIHYNLRVVEVTLASVVLAKLFDIALNPDHSSLGFSLRNFQEEIMKKQGKLDHAQEEQVDAVLDIIKSKLVKESYTREDVAGILGISTKTLEENYMSKFPIQAESFKLRQRALHVLEEARRVLTFRGILSQSQKLDQEKLVQLGELMNATQESCSKVYECSCPEIDDICSIARRAGAYGSRLTGAGWGGCTVHLVPQNKIDAVQAALKKEYYLPHFTDINDEKMKEAIVISKPGQGSSVIHGAALDF
jgi:galactokinase